jgi:transcriptional regulator with XRE-family HTH domain
MRLQYNHDRMVQKPIEIPAEVEEQLRINIRELMAWRKMTQAELAKRLNKPQPWLSRRMSGGPKGTKFQVEDLDALASVFVLTPYELLRPGFGSQERRRGERRLLRDRRESAPTRKGINHGESIDVSDPLVLAETLTTIAEAIERLVAALLARHASTPRDSSSNRAQGHRLIRPPRDSADS